MTAHNEHDQDRTSPASPATSRGITVAEVLDAPCLQNARVLAGRDGMSRVVQRLNIMEVPDILPWVKPREFLLTTAYPLREAPETLPGLVTELDQRGLSGLGIKVGRYIDSVPALMLLEADRLGFPVVQLPDDVAFDDILDQVLSHILNRETASLARSQEIHRKLISVMLAGGDLPELACEVTSLLGGPTAIVDLDGTVLATSDDGRAATLLEEAGELIHDELMLGIGSCGSESSGETPRFVHAPVLAGGGWSASIITFESERPLTDDDVVALEIAATVTALAITKAHAVGAVESKFQSEFLHDLLNDRVKSAAEAHARAAQFGWKFDHPLTVVIAEFRDPQPEGPDEWAARLSRVSRNMTSVLHARGDRDCAVVTLSREVVTIGAMSPDEPLEKRRQAMLKELSTLEPGVRIGVSRIVDGAMGIAAGYWQARKALDVGQRIVGQNAVVHFDDLGAFRILSLLNSGQEIQGFVSEVLGELANDDERSEEMLKTLQSLFEHNLNVAETARSMHYHYNTMRYRVERLQLALGPFTTDAELRFSLQLALRLLQIRND